MAEIAEVEKGWICENGDLDERIVFCGWGLIKRVPEG